MKIDLQKLFKRSEAVSFSKERKEEIRLKLETLMKETPVTAQEGSSVRNEFKWFVYLSQHTVTVSALLIFFLAGGTSLLAEGTLPGDFLYSVKTNVNEQVRGLLAGNAQERARWNLVLAERRLSEFGKLSSEDRLSVEQKEELKKKITNHTDMATKDFPLEEEDFDDRSIFESKARLLQERTEEKTEMSASLMIESKTTIEESGDNESVQKRIKESEEKISSIVSVLGNISNTETARAIHIKALIIKAQESLYEARLDLKDGVDDFSNLENVEELIRKAEEIINDIPKISGDLMLIETQESAVNKSIENLKRENRRDRVLEVQEREDYR